MNNPTALGGICDAVYDPNNAEEAKVHQHPEPQSGPPRDAFKCFTEGSNRTYDQWVVDTAEGRAWVRWKHLTRDEPTLPGAFYAKLVRQELASELVGGPSLTDELQPFQDYANGVFPRLVAAELAKVRSKHKPLNSSHEGYAVLLEELDELWEEVRRRDKNYTNMFNELVQIGAVAQRMAEDVVAASLSKAAKDTRDL